MAEHQALLIQGAWCKLKCHMICLHLPGRVLMCAMHCNAVKVEGKPQQLTDCIVMTRGWCCVCSFLQGQEPVEKSRSGGSRWACHYFYEDHKMHKMPPFTHTELNERYAQRPPMEMTVSGQNRNNGPSLVLRDEFANVRHSSTSNCDACTQWAALDTGEVSCVV